MAAAIPIALKVMGAAVASKTMSRTGKKSPEIPPPPQPEKEADDAQLFRRRRRGAGAYALTTPESLGSAPTASTKLGQ